MTNSIKRLQLVVVTLIILLVIQFEFGMTINLSDLPNLGPFGFSIPAVLGALSQIGVVAVTHAVLGTVLTILSLVSLGMALNTKLRRVQVLGVLSFLSMVLAASSGVLFTLSGFQNDHYSHGMATNFILTFSFYFLELYALKSAEKAEVNPKREEKV
jgi:hypothetical protein